VAFIDTNNTFSDIAVTSRLAKVNSFLKELDSIIDFEKLRVILNKNGVAKSNVAGAPSYDNVLMFKVLLLQKYYNLSDQATEDALYVNLLYIRFVGLSLEVRFYKKFNLNFYRMSNIFISTLELIHSQAKNCYYCANNN